MSTKAKHTQGPWFADGQGGGTLAFAKKHSTALMIRGRNCTVAEVIPHGNATEANARLIAAAPDLLEVHEKNANSLAVARMGHCNQELTCLLEAAGVLP